MKFSISRSSRTYQNAEETILNILIKYHDKTLICHLLYCHVNGQRNASFSSIQNYMTSHYPHYIIASDRTEFYTEHDGRSFVRIQLA